MSFSELQKSTERHLELCIDKANLHFNKSFHYHELCFDLRGGAAGQFVVKRSARVGQHFRLRFNSELLKEFQHSFIEEVVPHECAHLIVYQYFGTRWNGRKVLPHGKEWKGVMRDIFGLEPRVRHKFELEGASKKSFLYACSCETRRHSLSIIRHNKILRGKAKYACKNCQEELRFIAEG